MITKIAHVCLSSKDLGKSIAFYKEILKLRPKFHFRKGKKIVGVYFEVAKGNYIEIFPRETGATVNTGIKHFCLETKNIRKLGQWFDKKGIKHTELTLGCDNSWQTWIKDPDGNNIEFHQYASKSAQYTGRDVQVNW